MNLSGMIGIGVAGNFTGHLEQAGESSDFIGVEVDSENAPKGIFPFFLPSCERSHLSQFPISPIVIKRPNIEANLQAEPEVALICEIVYDSEKVKTIIPKKFAAFNDCSIRRDGAKKISDKKHWGASSKGISPNLIDIDSFTRSGVLDGYNIASFLKRDEVLHEYGVDSAVNSYSYFYEKLLEWIIHKINTQCDGGPLECIGELVRECGYPREAMISIGATRYTEFGESEYLRGGDEIFVILYPRDRYSRDDILRKISNGSYQAPDISTLHQIVV